MVSFEEIQAAYYMVAATGVLVAAVFYILNLREQRRNMRLTLETRRISLIESIASRIITLEGGRILQDLMRCEWTDYEDFVRKYGSLYNPDANAKRLFYYGTYDSLGAMLRRGIVEAEDLSDHIGTGVIDFWAKYKPVIEESRRRLHGPNWLRDFEYLAGEMMKELIKKDPSYKVPESFGVRLPEK
jgi:hypothetical protein